MFDAVQANKAVRFIETYYIPSTLGKPIKLLDWQRKAVETLYGERDDQGRRTKLRFILSTAKKSGKNTLQAGILLYELLGNVCPSPFVVSASTTRENAGQLYRELSFSIRNNPKLNKLCKCLDSTKEIRCDKLNARYKAFSSDAGSAEGENISALVVDELHAHESDKLYRALEYSTIARRASGGGLSCIISTAGHDQSSLWCDLFRYAQSVQSGQVEDPGLLPLIFTTPDTADLDNPETWKLANPSLDGPGCFTSEDFARDLKKAKAEGTAAFLSFKRYRLNMWVQADDAYIAPDKWDRCLSPMSDEQLAYYPLYVGVDLSQTTDPCSVSCVWALPERKFYIKSHAWVCEEGVKRREVSNLPKYRQFAEEGVMTITPGTVNDYRKIRAHILDLRNRYNLKEVIFDQYNAIELCGELMSENVVVYKQPQNHKHYTAPMKDMDVATSELRIKHDGNKLLRWALANTRVDTDAYGNCKPSRDKSTDKIDPAISTLMAFGRAVQATVQARRSIYEDRGVLCF